MSGSHQEYLMKYVSNGPTERRKRKKSKECDKAVNLKIIEDDPEPWTNKKLHKNKRSPILSSVPSELEPSRSKWKAIEALNTDVQELLQSGIPISFHYDKKLEDGEFLLSEGVQSPKKNQSSSGLKKNTKDQNTITPTTAGSGEKEATVYRDIYGKKIDINEEKRLLEEKAKKLENGMSEDFVWKSGIKQLISAGEEVERLKNEVNAPFSIYRDNKELEVELKKRVHWGDPMAINDTHKKTIKDDQVYRGPEAPPNRFNIPPGYRWDGIDRSNGFEKRFFLVQNQKLADKQEAYAWSCEDL